MSAEPLKLTPGANQFPFVSEGSKRVVRKKIITETLIGHENGNMAIK
jgi:hypothetical protein